jgi:hypothetical protein
MPPLIVDSLEVVMAGNHQGPMTANDKQLALMVMCSFGVAHTI